MTTLTSEAPPTAAGAEAARLFSWQDYVVFSVSLALPLLVGVLFFVLSLNKASTEEFLLGERSMNFMAVSLSLVASLLNGIFVIGIPAEIHYFGIGACYMIVGLMIAVMVSSHVFVAKYQTMMFTSAYQYVEQRYNMATRVVASSMFCISVTLFLAVVLYVPALAFAQVTNFSFYGTIVITGIACTIYTTIGGIKAVIWTDAMQMLILLGGLIVMAVIGTVKVGGGSVVWEVAKRDGRAKFDVFSLDPRARTTFWTQSLGSAVTYIGAFTSNQMMVQRFMSVSSAAKAQKSLYGTVIICLPLLALVVFIGLVIHAYYADCDPLIKGTIARGDQILPLFLMDVTGDYHGIPGLIMSSIFAAALSSVSSVINSLSAVFLADFVDPAVLHFGRRKLSDKVRRWIAVGIVLFFGSVTIGLSFIANRFADKLVQATSIAWGVIGGPLAGIFIMGFLLPFVNSWGAISGMFGGLAVALWLSLGSMFDGPRSPTCSLGSCVANETFIPTTPAPTHPLNDWYGLSYSWYGAVGTGACIIIGIVVSLATGGLSHGYRSTRDPKVMFSVADECCCCCPLSCRKCYRCGVKFGEEDEVVLEKFNRIDMDQQYFQKHGKVQVYVGGHANDAYVADSGDAKKKENNGNIVCSSDVNFGRNINGISENKCVYVVDTV